MTHTSSVSTAIVRRACLQLIRSCLLLVPLACAASATAQTITVTGVIDASPQPQTAILAGPQGFTLSYPFTLNDNFIGLGINGCNGDPARCRPGATLSLETVTGDGSFQATLDGVSYRGGCFSCNTGITFQIAGSILLPPLAPTATATGRFTITGTLFAEGRPAVPFTGSGTATVYLHSPGTVGFPESWFVDRAVLWFDSPLPHPWIAVDVGTVGQAGTTSGSVTPGTDGTFAVAGAGADIWGSADAFQFAFAYPSGNQITARVDAAQNTNPFAKAGLMVRDGFNAGAAHVVLDVKPDGNVEFMTRPVAGGATTFIGGASVGFPVWLRLTQGTEIVGEVSSDGQTWQRVGGVPAFSAGLRGLVVTSHDAVLLNQAMFSHVSVTASRTEPLPAWQQNDIGSVSLEGSAAVDGTTLSVTGDGADIWGVNDAFHYVYRVASTEGEIVARVTSLQNTSPFAKAGVMFRADLTSNAPHVMLDVKPDGGIEFMSRPSNAAPTTFIAGAVQQLPAWLRLQRSGSHFTASISSDGASWTPIGSADTTGIGIGYVGLAVTSHDTATLNTAVFDNIGVTLQQPLPLPWVSNNIGATGLNGGATFSDGTFIVTGAGADIWGTADAFNFVHQPSAMPTLSARVVSLTNTHPFAKAGLMIRQGLQPGAPFVMIDMKPGGELEVLQRSALDEPATYVGGAFAAAGSFLRLQRSGQAVTASYSADGTAWTTVSTVPISMDMTTEAGLVVTSHDVTQFNGAVFDSVVGP